MVRMEIGKATEAWAWDLPTSLLPHSMVKARHRASSESGRGEMEFDMQVDIEPTIYGVVLL